MLSLPPVLQSRTAGRPPLPSKAPDYGNGLTLISL
ncbi:MAG: hypothetical protein BWY83_01678 [bacterium ADurb.Bin478]|nr:MAG: hypothetical protein BWY83_01678 [bacterium ADurb.Bin478]